MKRVLVTGGAGFIGSHLCEALIAAGYHVTCLDNYSTGSWDNIKHLTDLKVIEGDVNQRDFFALLPREPFDLVFHYAATVGVRRTENQPELVLADVCGIRHVAELALQGRARKIIFASSSEVYGEPRHLPVEENDGVIGWTPYSTVKLYGEHLFAALWQTHGIPTISLRFFNVYGPRQRSNSYGFVVAQFILQALTGQPLTIYGDGSQTRDFVYIDDNIRAALLAAQANLTGQIINIGFGREIAIADLAKLILSLTGRTEQSDLNFLPARKVEIMRRLADTKRLAATLGITNTVSLEQGLRQTIAAFASELTPAIPAIIQPTSQIEFALPPSAVEP